MYLPTHTFAAQLKESGGFRVARTTGHHPRDRYAHKKGPQQSPTTVTSPPWRPRKPTLLASGSKAEGCRYGHNTPTGCPCAAAARTCGRAEVPWAAQLPLSHPTHSALTRSELPAVPTADQRYPIGCVAAPAGASMEGSVGLPCAAVCRLSAGCAWRRRHSGDRFRSDVDRPRRKATSALPRRRDSSGIVPAECPGPSALAQRPARLASGQFGRTAQHP
jgi:hypothetical protein